MRREQLEEIAAAHMGEGIRKFVPKIVQKAYKLTAFYMNKTQVTEMAIIVRLGVLSEVWAITGTRISAVQQQPKDERVDSEQRCLIHGLDDPTVYQYIAKIKTESRAQPFSIIYSINPVDF